MDPVMVHMITAFILMPFIALAFQRSDRKASTAQNIGCAAVAAALWPLVLLLLVVLWPTLAVLSRDKRKHAAEMKAKRTEQAVLAKMEAEAKAEEARIAAQFKELEDEENRGQNKAFLDGIRDEMTKVPRSTAQARAEAELLRQMEQADAVERLNRARRAGYTYREIAQMEQADAVERLNRARRAGYTFSEISQPGFWKNFPEA